MATGDLKGRAIDYATAKSRPSTSKNIQEKNTIAIKMMVSKEAGVIYFLDIRLFSCSNTIFCVVVYYFCVWLLKKVPPEFIMKTKSMKLGHI